MLFTRSSRQLGRILCSNRIRQPEFYPLTSLERCQSNVSTSQTSQSSVSTQLWNGMKFYEDIIGITEVKEAQRKVVLAEQEFSSNQERRREKQEEIANVQYKMREIHSDLDKTSRGEDRYLHLLTQEHSIVKQERALNEDFSKLERLERDAFSRLSFFLRESHEKERERGERTKYWSIIGSCIGAAIGIIGATINNRLRMRDLRALVTESSTGQGLISSSLVTLTKTVDKQQKQIQSFVTDVSSLVGGSTASKTDFPRTLTNLPAESQIEMEEFLVSQNKILISAMEKQGIKMEEIKKILAVNYANNSKKDGNSVIYVGPEIEDILDKSNQNLEWRLKWQVLYYTVFGYGVLAISLPIVYMIFRG